MKANGPQKQKRALQASAGLPEPKNCATCSACLVLNRPIALEHVDSLAMVVTAVKDRGRALGELFFLDSACYRKTWRKIGHTAPTADENSPKEMGEILSAAQELQSRVSGRVVLEGLL